jgi:hypothetical protein
MIANVHGVLTKACGPARKHSDDKSRNGIGLSGIPHVAKARHTASPAHGQPGTRPARHTDERGTRPSRRTRALSLDYLWYVPKSYSSSGTDSPEGLPNG